MPPSVLFSYASSDSSTDTGACFFGGLGRGEVCPSDLARGRFSSFSAGAFLTMEASAPFGGSALTLLEEPRGGLAALVILIFGLGTELEAAEGTGALEDEELPETPWAFSADLEVETPDNFSSRRRRICKTQPLATSSARTMSGI